MRDTLFTRPSKETIETLKRSQAQKLTASRSDPAVLSDSAALMLYSDGAGSAENALALLEQAEERAPGLYANAINRATALELLGRLDEARDWVEEARNRNRQPQAGTEWLHQLILQAQLELRTNPDWLKTNSVLGADFGADVKPQLPRVPDRETWAKRSRQALLFQLRDRLPTSAKPNPILADMLFDFANLQSLSGSPGSALELYELALDYGIENVSLAERRANSLREQAPPLPLSSRSNQIILLFLTGIAVAGFLRLYLIRRKRPKRGEKTGE